jgi:UDP-N-acetylmuramate dehydrogenase
MIVNNLEFNLVSLDEMKAIFRGRITLSEPLARYTSFQIGGPADYYLEPADREDCATLVTYCRERQLPFLVMGKGSNMLVSDDGFRGAVINLEYGLNAIEYSGGCIVVEAGVTLSRFVDFCIQHGLRGVEMLPGIPGTIGGAIIMNAGAHGGEISDHLVDVDILRDAAFLTVRKEEGDFSYRRSGFGEDVVLGARFRFPEGDKTDLMRTRRELLIKRNRVQPVNFPNSGSMFKNPRGTYAAKLIEDAGLKGLKKGNGQISDRHANFMINLGGASAMDVLELVEHAQKVVFEKFGIHLELEVKLIGFAEEVVKEVWT